MNKKFLVISIIMIVALLVLGTNSFATDDTVKVTYTYPSNDGTIVVMLSELNLEETGEYQFGLTTKDMSTPTKWYTITERTSNTAEITLSPKTDEIKEILAKTDEGIIWIKQPQVEDLISIKVNLKLPYHYAVTSPSLHNGKYIEEKNYAGYQVLIHSKYGLMNKYYQFEKITDKEIINKWLEYKNSDSNNILDVYELINSKKEVPVTEYNSMSNQIAGSNGQMGENHFKDRKDGLYLLWCKFSDDNCKTIYGYAIYDGLYDTGKTFENYSDTDKVEDLTATVKYSTSVSTTGSVTATIICNKPVSKVDGWELSDDEKTLTKIYTENKTESITLKDKDDKTTTVTINVSNIVKDNTIATSDKLPQTGSNILIVSLVLGMAIVVYVAYRKNKEYKNIK